MVNKCNLTFLYANEIYDSLKKANVYIGNEIMDVINDHKMRSKYVQIFKIPPKI